MVAQFKAIELDASSRQRTGREHTLDAETRQDAISVLIGMLGVPSSAVTIDPTRTMVRVDQRLWTIVAKRPTSDAVNPSLRRGGAKHKTVR